MGMTVCLPAAAVKVISQVLLIPEEFHFPSLLSCLSYYVEELCFFKAHLYLKLLNCLGAFNLMR